MVLLDNVSNNTRAGLITIQPSTEQIKRGINRATSASNRKTRKHRVRGLATGKTYHAVGPIALEDRCFDNTPVVRVHAGQGDVHVPEGDRFPVNPRLNTDDIAFQTDVNR